MTKRSELRAAAAAVEEAAAMKVRDDELRAGQRRRHTWYKWYLSLSRDQLRDHYSRRHHTTLDKYNCYSGSFNEYIQADNEAEEARAAKRIAKRIARSSQQDPVE